MRYFRLNERTQLETEYQVEKNRLRVRVSGWALELVSTMPGIEMEKWLKINRTAVPPDVLHTSDLTITSMPVILLFIVNKGELNDNKKTSANQTDTIGHGTLRTAIAKPKVKGLTFSWRKEVSIDTYTILCRANGVGS